MIMQRISSDDWITNRLHIHATADPLSDAVKPRYAFHGPVVNKEPCSLKSYSILSSLVRLIVELVFPLSLSMARTLVTSNNLSPLVLILTWLLCIISVLSVLARGGAKLIFTRSIKSDDYSSLLSLVILPSCSQLLLILLTRK